MADPLSPAVSDRICKHMNEDHADAIALYARVFGQSPQVSSARMLAIDPEGMDLEAQVEDQQVRLRISFDHPLQDSEDAHHTLIEMVKQARQVAS
jgi:putative heme iron utilization protein